MTTTTVAVEFASPLLGLHPHTSYALDRVEGAPGLYALRSVDEGVRLFLLDPAAGGDDYEPPLPASVWADLGADDRAEVRTFVVANPAEGGVFLNLRAPILIHRESGRAVQVILEDQRYPVRALLGASGSALSSHE